MENKEKNEDNLLSVIQVYQEDKEMLDKLATFRHESYKDILHRLVKKSIKFVSG